MNQKSTNELIRRQGHRLLPIVFAIILPKKTDPVIFYIEQTVIGNGDTMSVAAHVVEDLLWTAKRGFGIDDPFGLLQWSQVGTKFAGILEFFQRSGEPEFAGVESLFQLLEKQPAEETGKDAHRQEEARPAGDPLRGVG